MGILKDEIIGIIIGKGDNIISNKFQELMNEKRYSRFCEEIPGIVEKRVLFPIESERYFDDLHSFYLSRKVVAKFVISLISTNSKSVVFLSNKFAEEFVRSYPQHKTAKNRIEELLIMSADIIESEIKNRELVTDDQEIILFIAQKNKEILEGQIRVEEKVDEIGNSVKRITQKLEDIQKDANRNVSSVLSIGQLADDTEFAVEIKDVEENIQKELKFSQAITRYNELITDIKENIDRPDELLTYIYINLALCYANSDDFVHAERSLSYAQKYCDWSKNAKYYYVKGYVCWKRDKSNIYNAIEWLPESVSLALNYFHNAT
jgi:tetratricopeptide (TPR) repeat protein